MAMDATCQIRMDSDLKTQVEELYRSLGTSFAEAVRMFARQSVQEGGMPFRPVLKTWDEMTPAEIEEKISRSRADIVSGRVYTLDEADAMMSSLSQ